MIPKLTIVDSEKQIEELIEYLSSKEYIAYDCETNGIHRDARVIGFSVCASEDEAFYVILEEWRGGTLIQKPYLYQIPKLLQLLKTKSLVMHNAVFDCRIAETFFKIRLVDAVHTDTMILAHLLNENRRVGLKELSTEYFGGDSSKEQAEMKASVLANGGKLTKDCYEMYKCDSYILAKYGAKDALLTYKLFLKLVPELFEQGLDKFFYEDESMPLLKGPTYELNTEGLRIDQNALLTLKKQLEAECAEAKDFIYAEIAERVKIKYDKFNLNSKQQLAWLLFGNYGLEFNTLTDSGREACKNLGLKLPYTISAKRDFIHACQVAADKKLVLSPEGTVNGKKIKAKYAKEPWAYIQVDKTALEKHSSKLKWVAKLLEYQKKMKLLTTYATGIEERTQYGIIYPSFLQHGTTSGRYSSRDPNFQNLPRDDKRIKSCIIPRPGKTFVGADYSQLEPRVFAYYSGDDRLLKSFKGDDDFYSTIGIEVYSIRDAVPKKDGRDDAFGIKYKELRDISKVIALASTYGATPHQLAKITKRSIDDTTNDILRYFETFPRVKEMMLESHKLAKSQGYVENLFGRRRRMPEAQRINKLYGNVPHEDLPYEARNTLNLAVNHRIQSTGASIVNRAAIRFYNNTKEIGVDCKIVLQVHDSLVIECQEKDASDVALLLRDAMENTVDLETVKLEAIPKIGKDLSKV